MIKKAFQFIDSKIFASVDQLKLSGPFQQVLAPLDNLSDEIQSIINKVIAFLIPTVPVVIFIFAIVFNIQSRVAKSDKEQLLGKMQEISGLSSEASGHSRQIIAPISIADKQGFQTRLGIIARKAGFTADNVKVKSFLQEEMGSINKSLIDVTFSGLSTKQFTSFVNEILINEKIKVERVKLKKVKTLLEGSFSLIHFSKQLVLEAEEGSKK